MHFHCLHRHTYTHWRRSKISLTQMHSNGKSKRACCLPSDPLLNLLPLTHLVEMESYLAKTAAGTLASNILPTKTYCSHKHILHEIGRAGWKIQSLKWFVLSCSFHKVCTDERLEKQCICVFPSTADGAADVVVAASLLFISILFCVHETRVFRIIIQTLCLVKSFLYQSSGGK